MSNSIITATQVAQRGGFTTLDKVTNGKPEYYPIKCKETGKVLHFKKSKFEFTKRTDNFGGAF